MNKETVIKYIVKNNSDISRDEIKAIEVYLSTRETDIIFINAGVFDRATLNAKLLALATDAVNYVKTLKNEEVNNHE